jgi:putative membrane protein
MELIIKIIIALVALIHIYILWLEMFAWTTRGKKTFKNFPEHLFEPTKALAANQGLYNGFLAAGLIWSLIIRDTSWAHHVSVFFLTCVLIAAVYGTFTADKKIFFVQGLLPLIGLALILLKPICCAG